MPLWPTIFGRTKEGTITFIDEKSDDDEIIIQANRTNSK